MYQELYIENDYGAIDGYTVSVNEENYKNYLISETNERGKAKIIIEEIEKIGNEVLVIKNINIEDEHRGQGFGKMLMEEAMSESGADIILLVADAYESQLPGFVLEKFYQKFDFEKVMDTGAGPLMVYPSEIAESIKQKLESTIQESKKSRKMKPI